MAKIVIAGGHGKVALIAEQLLVQAGHEVDALIRDPQQEPDIEATGAKPVVLSLEEAGVDKLAEAFDGADAVVWAAGAGGGDPARTYAVDRDGASRAVDAAAQVGIGRFIMVSWFGARADHGVDPADSFWHYAEAKYAADRYVQAKAPGWTILGPSGLTLEDPTGKIEIDDNGSVEHGTVTRADVAALIVAAIDRPELAGKFIRFNNGDTPIDTALDALA